MSLRGGTLSKPVTLTDISPRAWEHPADAAALAALQKVPGFDKVVAKTFGRLNEWTSMQRLGARATRVTKDSHPRLFDLYTDVLDRLDAPAAWPLYVVEMPVINAATMGMDKPFITIADKALTDLPDDRIQVILAHEVGHIMSGHMLYKTMLRVGLYLGWAALSFPVSAPIIAGVMAGLLEWDRKSELSADRASVLALQDPEAVCATLRCVQERHKAAMDEDREEIGMSEEAWRRIQGFVKVVSHLVSRHPPVDRRIEEIDAWVASGAYQRVLDGDYPRRSDDPPPTDWSTLGGLSDLGERTRTSLEGHARTFAEWLKAFSEG